MVKWLGVLLLAGCTTAQWEKPGATAEGIDADLRGCSMVAQSVPTLPASRTTSSSVEVRSTGTGVAVHEASRVGDSDRQLQQAQRVQDCMRQKGYSLKAG